MVLKWCNAKFMKQKSPNIDNNVNPKITLTLSSVCLVNFENTLMYKLDQHHIPGSFPCTSIETVAAGEFKEKRCQ